MVDGLPGWEVVRQQSPGTPTTQDVEDGVEDLAQRVHSGTPWGFGGRQMGLLYRTTRHRIGRFDMLFSCSVEYRAAISGALFGQFQKGNSQKFDVASCPGRGLEGV